MTAAMEPLKNISQGIGEVSGLKQEADFSLSARLETIHRHAAGLGLGCLCDLQCSTAAQEVITLVPGNYWDSDAHVTKTTQQTRFPSIGGCDEIERCPSVCVCAREWNVNSVNDCVFMLLWPHNSGQ